MKTLIRKPIVLEPDGTFRETDIIIKDDKISHVDLSDDLEVFVIIQSMGVENSSCQDLSMRTHMHR